VGQRVLITGITGQDGSYLAELLCAEGAEVHGTVRGSTDRVVANLAGVREQVTLHQAELDTPGQLRAVVAALAPDEIYHLAAPGFVPDSWRQPSQTIRAIAGSGGELLEAVRDHAPNARVVVASTREIFGAEAPSPQSESTLCSPSSPYGVAKLALHQLVGLVREGEGLHASSAILFNHESPRRPESFISRKVTRGVAAISLGLAEEIVLGDLDAVRDWSAASDIVHGLRSMARAEQPADYVLASGVGHTVRELVDVACAVVAVDAGSHLRVDERFVRESEGSDPIGDPARAHAQLGWSARVSFEELIADMVRADLAELSAGVDAGAGATRR
jgi:GDPmannose 4,6-dehydratase